MLSIDLDSNLDDIIGLLNDIEVKHIPYALSFALNQTAEIARKEVIRQMPDRFLLRNGRTVLGIRRMPATKNRLVAHVGSKDWFLRDQETGGIRRPGKLPAIFVPTNAVRRGGTLAGMRAGAKPATIMRQIERAKLKTPRRKKRGKGKLKSIKPFLVTMKNGKQAIFRRRFQAKRLPIVMLYRLEKSIRIDPRWKFEETAVRISDKHLRKNFVDAMIDALKTDKRGARRSGALEHLSEHGEIIGAPITLGSVSRGLRR